MTAPTVARPQAVPGETPAEHLRNAQQLLRAFIYLTDEQKAGQEGQDVICAIAFRVSVARAGIEP